MDPAVGLGLAQVEEAAQQYLQRVGFLIDEEEQQLVFGAQEYGLPACPAASLAGLPGMGSRRREGASVDARERREQALELRGRQARECHELAIIPSHDVVV